MTELNALHMRNPLLEMPRFVGGFILRPYTPPYTAQWRAVVCEGKCRQNVDVVAALVDDEANPRW